MQKYKVLHVVGALNMGGAETMIMNIFRNIDRQKFQFDFFLSGNSGGYYESEVLELGGKIFNVGRRKKNIAKYCVELYRLIRKEKYDVIQVHGTDAMDGLPIFISWFAGAKKRCLFSHNTDGQSMLRQKIMRGLFMPFVTHPQACSDMAAVWMFGKKGYRAKIIPLPIDCSRCKYNLELRETERKKWDVTPYFVIGHIGRFQRQKNHIRLIRIFSEIVKKNPNYRLMLIGTGSLKDEINKLIINLKLENYVIFMGQIPGACIELSMFDVMLFPSLYEGFPTVLLEAQANGLPVVASDSITPTIALTDLIEFQSLNAPDELWAEKVLKTQKRKDNPFYYYTQIAQKYDLKIVVKTFENLYGLDEKS